MNPQSRQTGEVSHERKDADVINLLMIALFLALVIGLCLLVCWAVLRSLNRNREAEESPPLRMAEQATRFPQPQLIIKSGDELRQTRLAAQTKLNSYGWVDRKAGVTHIPIARAMELLLERGLPVVGEGQTRLQLLQSRPVTEMQAPNPITSPNPEATP